MKEIPMKHFLPVLEFILRQSLSSDHVALLCGCDEFVRDVKEDVETTSGWETDEDFGDDDVRLAIGRVICDKFEIYS